MAWMISDELAVSLPWTTRTYDENDNEVVLKFEVVGGALLARSDDPDTSNGESWYLETPLYQEVYVEINEFGRVENWQIAYTAEEARDLVREERQRFLNEIVNG
jgi:hypothetical protein